MAQRSNVKKIATPGFEPSEGMASLGRNVWHRIEGEKLVIEIDLSGDLGPSASGKSRKVATTSGNVNVAGIKLGLNAYEPI